MNSTPTSRPGDTRYKILHLLKVNGPKSVRELADALGLSSMGIRQNLISLEGAGLIHHYQEQRGVGRPQFIYALTKEGDEEHFPRAYAPELMGLLAAIEDLEGAAGLDRIFEQRTEQLVEEYRGRMPGEDLEERVKGLASIRTEEGFMAEWEKEGEDSFVLREHNCAIYQVASSCEQLCTFEQELFCRVLDDAEITRESHILAGDPNCSYLIERRR